VLGADFYRENLLWGGKLLGVNIPGEMSHWGDLTELLYEILFNCPTFSLPNFSFGDVSGELPRAFFSACFNFREIISTEGGISGVIEKPIRD
jgi:hypothetical protein